MKPITFMFMLCAAFASIAAADELEMNGAKAVNVSIATTKIEGRTAMVVTKDPKITADDEATFARIAGPEFTNGTIEVKVLSRLLKNAPDHARGFIGIAFRINGDNSKFESIYIRPTNGRAEDQLRRNRSIQYFSYPDFKYDRLRQEAPGKYEAYADMSLDEWINLRIEVKGNMAKLFLNGALQPSLIVDDLKHGAESAGAIGLWVDVGTEGFFTDLKVIAE